jgi:hypothetical protein
VKRKESHTELIVFYGNIHILEEIDKILGGCLIPLERQKKDSKESKEEEKTGQYSAEKNQEQGKVFRFCFPSSRI